MPTLSETPTQVFRPIYVVVHNAQTLFRMMGENGPAYIALPTGERGILQSVEREDGSGRSFNVTITLSNMGYRNNTVTKYIRFAK